MEIFHNNISILLKSKEVSGISLYTGGLFICDYIGFKLEDTIYLIAQLTPKEAEEIMKQPQKLPGIVNSIIESNPRQAMNRQHLSGNH